MKNKNKSAISWVRSQLGAKGKSNHSGRGSYFCDADNFTPKELWKKVNECLKKWMEEDLLESVEEKDDCLYVRFKNVFKEKNDYYRGFNFLKKENTYYCIFTLDNLSLT